MRGSAFSIPDLPDRATLVDGAWPSAPEQVTVQADGAATWTSRSATSCMGDAEVTISGTWRVNDQLDPRWLGETLLSRGSTSRTSVPSSSTSRSGRRLDTDPRARWTLVPDVSALTSSDLVDIVDEWNGLATEWRGQVTTQLITLEKHGRFKRTALELAAASTAFRRSSRSCCCCSPRSRS